MPVQVLSDNGKVEFEFEKVRDNDVLTRLWATGIHPDYLVQRYPGLPGTVRIISSKISLHVYMYCAVCCMNVWSTVYWISMELSLERRTRRRVRI